METMLSTILTFQGERGVFLREQANNMYSVGAYYWARVIIDIPL